MVLIIKIIKITLTLIVIGVIIYWMFDDSDNYPPELR